MAEDQEIPKSEGESAIAEAERIISEHKNNPGLSHVDISELTDDSKILANLPEPPDVNQLPTDSLTARQRLSKFHKPQK